MIAQSMAPEYGPRDLHVAPVAIDGRIDGDSSARGSAPSRSAFRITASKVQTEESFAQSVIKCPDLVRTMLRKAEGEKTGDM